MQIRPPDVQYVAAEKILSGIFIVSHLAAWRVLCVMEGIRPVGSKVKGDVRSDSRTLK